MISTWSAWGRMSESKRLLPKGTGRCFCTKSNFEQGARPPIDRYTRQYFYVIDEHGQLFMQDTKVKNFITAFKDNVFLDFFHKRIRKNDTGLFTQAFPYISPCGRELNFIEPVDSVFVFRQLLGADLIWGGTLRSTFYPDQLSMNEYGRIYHPSPDPSVTERALISSHLGIEMGKYITFADDGTASILWDNARYPRKNYINVPQHCHGRNGSVRRT